MHYAQKASTTITALVCTLFGAGALLAPATAHANNFKMNSYAAKVVCEQDGTSEVETDVNVHNPHWTPDRKEFFWTLSPAYDYQSNAVGASTGPYRGFIYKNQTISIDCEFVMYEQCNGAEFEGFVIILSWGKLDVVGVYEIEENYDGEMTVDVDVVPVEPTVVTITSSMLSQWRNSANGNNGCV